MENGNQYVSSIINNYNDMANVKSDLKTLQDIYERQGTTMLIRSIAENAGEACNKFKLDSHDRWKLRQSLVNELFEALAERT